MPLVSEGRKEFGVPGLELREMKSMTLTSGEYKRAVLCCYLIPGDEEIIDGRICRFILALFDGDDESPGLYGVAFRHTPQTKTKLSVDSLKRRRFFGMNPCEDQFEPQLASIASFLDAGTGPSQWQKCAMLARRTGCLEIVASRVVRAWRKQKLRSDRRGQHVVHPSVRSRSWLWAVGASAAGCPPFLLVAPSVVCDRHALPLQTRRNQISARGSPIMRLGNGWRG
ncbi:hypothetical protein CC86DRAFT_8860 [Ophiobolus disseminans]|uniref:Uncharacterized protein n=1 Tax=Ophiobolus disseminans TaxID=1469910 RepID=A0A6A7AJB3_9PLEO|nr:hypothetical protein CC86DRAFT_8860 [Ophiobolus disseminans]